MPFGNVLAFAGFVQPSIRASLHELVTFGKGVSSGLRKPSVPSPLSRMLLPCKKLGLILPLLLPTIRKPTLISCGTACFVGSFIPTAADTF